MSATAKKLSRRSHAAPAVGRLVIRRDPATGRVVVDDILSSMGNLVVKGGPITGGNSRRVFVPQGRTKMSRKTLNELVRLMRMKLPA